MLLDRLNDMELAVSKETKELLDKRISQIMENYEAEKESLNNMMEIILKGLAEDQRGILTISYLRSSAITKSHGFYIAFYGGEPFVEENPDGVTYRFQTLFSDVDEDISKIVILLKKQFIRVLSSEIEEIRRRYIFRVYVESEKLFQRMLTDMDGVEKKEVYFGEYMGEVAKIGMI